MSAQGKPHPCLIQINGQLASGCLIPGVIYKVAEVRERWVPSFVEHEPDKVTTVIRFEPVTPDASAGLDVEIEA